MKEYKIRAIIDCPDCADKLAAKLERTEGIEKADFIFSEELLRVRTDLSRQRVMERAKEIDDDVTFPDDVKTLTLRAEIDCAECALKIENGLKKLNAVDDAVFDFPHSTLTVTSILTMDEIREEARKIEDDIDFPSESSVFVFNVDIDCAECAAEVEEALLGAEGVTRAVFDYPGRKLEVETILTEDEIRKICLSVEEDMVFLDTVGKKERKDFLVPRILISLLMLLVSLVTDSTILALLSYVIAGWDVLLKAVRNILKGKVFDENFLMSLATVCAVFTSNFHEAAGVMVFYQTGEYFQKRAADNSRRNIEALLDISDDKAEVKSADGYETVDADKVPLGSLIRIKPGAKVGIDGIVVEGTSFLDTKAVTGESVPRKAEEGDTVLSGSINGEGTMVLRTTALYAESTATKIVRLVEESGRKKAKSEKFITRFSRIYTPLICSAALLLFLLSPLFSDIGYRESLYRASMLLVISCPCALVLSVPLTYFSSMGSFARRGILVKGDDSIQKLPSLSLLALDKTGTITEGEFRIREIDTPDPSALLRKAAALEKNSTHPIAKAIVREAPLNYEEAADVKEIGGIGIEGRIGNHVYRCGNARILPPGTEIRRQSDGSVTYVTEDGKLIGTIIISDRVKETTREALEKIRNSGVREIWMLSGDSASVCKRTAEDVRLDGAVAELLPSEKVTELEKLMEKGMVTAYAGDGINDAPTLRRADIGIAMGGVGSDAAIDAADIVIMNDDLDRIHTAMMIARKTARIVRENIILSLSVKALVFLLAAFGMGNMWFAVFADTGVALLAVLNAMRALSYRD